MRMISKLVSCAFSVALAAGLLAVPAFADEATEATHDYQITVYAGNQGTISQVPEGWVSNGDSATVSVGYGEKLSFNGFAVTVQDSEKYYVKGIRPAEQNNGYQKYYAALADANGVMTEEPASYVADKDQDFVVAYGLKSERVGYTVRFVDVNGNDILNPMTYTGNVGDEIAPVASYIDGYVPNAVMQTKTLGRNEADNVVAFTYRNVPGVTTVQLPGNVIQVITGTGATATIEPAAPDAEGATPEVVADDGTVIIDDTGTPLAAPADELSLDDNETPLAEGSTFDSEAASGAANPINWMLPVLLLCIAAGVIVFLALMFRARRKEQNDQQNH